MGEILRAQGEFPFLIFLLFLILIVGGIIYGLIWQRKRREALMAEARRLGLQFEPKSSESLHKLYRHLTPFASGRGGNPRSLSVMRGRYRGLEVRLMDFVYTVHTGKTSHDVWLAVALMLGSHQWPRLTIVPEGVAHKIFDALGGDDIDFESEEFSRSHWVRSDDRRFAYDVVHPRMMEFLMAPGWDHWHMQGNAICLWEAKRLKPGDTQGILDRLVGFHELIPGHVRAAHGGPMTLVAHTN